MDVPVLVFLYLSFGGYHRAALAALDEAAQRTRIVFLPVLPAPPFHHGLRVVKKFLGDDGLVLPFVKLFVVAEQPVVEGVGKDVRYPLAGHGLPALRRKAVLRKEGGYVLQAGIALGVEFKRGLNDFRARLMDDDGFLVAVVQIADGSKRRVFSSLNFGIKAALGVRRQIKDELVSHAELHAHQEHIIARMVIAFVGANVLNSAAL